VQPGDAVLVDVEVLADQLAQQPMRVSDLLVEQQLTCFNGLQRSFGVLGVVPRDLRQ
jgi:hypothetical protein